MPGFNPVRGFDVFPISQRNWCGVGPDTTVARASPSKQLLQVAGMELKVITGRL